VLHVKPNYIEAEFSSQLRKPRVGYTVDANYPHETPGSENALNPALDHDRPQRLASPWRVLSVNGTAHRSAYIGFERAA
jgi:hypothetical protein